MGRAITAFFAFNIYALFLLAAFEMNTGYLFDAEKIADLRAAGVDLNLSDWGWQGHYIWRLFAGVLVTAIAGGLAGSISIKKGGIVAAVSNVPSVLIWALIFYVMAFSSYELPEKTGFLIVSLIAIPLTTLIAYRAGEFGAELQETGFPEGTVLGLKGRHLFWLIVPIYVYALGIVYVIAKFVSFSFYSGHDMSMVSALLNMFVLIPILAWGMPLYYAYAILSGELLHDRNPFLKALAVFGVLTFGLMLAVVVQLACHWLFDRLGSWWYS